MLIAFAFVFVCFQMRENPLKLVRQKEKLLIMLLGGHTASSERKYILFALVDTNIKNIVTFHRLDYRKLKTWRQVGQEIPASNTFGYEPPPRASLRTHPFLQRRVRP